MQRVLKLINAMIYALGSIDTYDRLFFFLVKTTVPSTVHEGCGLFQDIHFHQGDAVCRVDEQ